MKIKKRYFDLFENKSIKSKLINIVLLGTGVTLFLAYISIVIYTIFTFENDLENQLSSIADIIGNNSKAAIVFEDSDAGIEILSALSNDKKIVSATIYDAKGEVFASYSSLNNAVSNTKVLNLRDPGFSKDNKNIYLLKPIYLKNKRIGSLAITADKKAMYNKLYNFAGILLLILLISIIPTMFIFNRLQKIISKPVENLTKVANYVSKNKDYTARANKTSGDELAILVDRFNEMLDQIQERDSKLKREVDVRKRAELNEKISKDRYQTLFDQSPAGVYIFNKDLDIIQCNKKMAEIVSTSINKVTGLNIYKLKDTKFLDDHLRVFDGISSNVENFYDTTGNNNQLWLSIKFSPIYDNENNIINGMAVVEDITTRKNNEELLKSSLNEKEILLKEIHHRVKNNLQIISSILNLQSESIEDKYALELFNESQARINSMALIHERLYRSSQFEYVDFSSYLRDLTNYLISSHQTSLHNIDVNMDIKDVNLNIDTAVPCGLIINELIINSIKHAFPKEKIRGNKYYNE